MNQTVALLLGTAVLASAAAAAVALQRRARARARLWGDAEGVTPRRELGRIARWLSLAGMRGAGAPVRFAAACVAAVGTAVALALFLGQSPALVSAVNGVAAIPVVGLPLARIVSSLPWLSALLLSAVPVLVVRARRERRVAAVEEDLPLLLELLATLAEGGLGFDASLDRVVESEPSGRPLAQELRLYQLEVLGGGSRSECLRRLAGRLEVPAVTSAVAALVQAEETGSGLAEVLRPLAEDLRLRRRERALARAEALPEKLVFPLVLGFLPGLLVWTLGPSFHQLFGIVDSIMRGVR
jgi:pilus assembly protein TadC